MCGIVVRCSWATDQCAYDDKEEDDLRRQCARRGPDALDTIDVRCGVAELRLTASVLHLRGDAIVPQPLTDCNRGVLCWNGEAWRGLGIDATHGSDTLALSRQLAAGVSLIEVLDRIVGPFAIIWLDVSRSRLYYARDVLGRRSLLCKPSRSGIALSSVAGADRAAWHDVEAGKLFCIDLQTFETTEQALRRPYGAIDRGLAQPDETRLSAEVDHFTILLRESVRTRMTAPHSTPDVAVMFSGGVDCTVLARLMHDCLPSDRRIVLINVAFENARVKDREGMYTTPDRRTALQSLAELEAACGKDRFRLLLVDVPMAEAEAAEADVMRLAYPNDTVMDLSIALAFYFCARGLGRWHDSGEAGSISAKVLISGLGADELLGGYSRHRAAAGRDAQNVPLDVGDSHLLNELQLDLDRLPSRNLGRDDRIVSAWGRECRWPFLDERVVDYLCRLPVQYKCRFDGDVSVSSHESVPGDKMLLRFAAHRLGLPLAAREKKRAVQFGARSARMRPEAAGCRSSKGHDVV